MPCRITHAWGRYVDPVEDAPGKFGVIQVLAVIANGLAEETVSSFGNDDLSNEVSGVGTLRAPDGSLT